MVSPADSTADEHTANQSRATARRTVFANDMSVVDMGVRFGV